MKSWQHVSPTFWRSQCYMQIAIDRGFIFGVRVPDSAGAVFLAVIVFQDAVDSARWKPVWEGTRRRWIWLNLVGLSPSLQILMNGNQILNTVMQCGALVEVDVSRLDGEIGKINTALPFCLFVALIAR